MLGILPLRPFPAGLPLADSIVNPLAILLLCVAAGIGTVLLLPARQRGSVRKLGAAVLAAAVLILVALLVRAAGGRDVSGTGPYFWIFSAIAVVGAIRVITHPRPVYSALYFVLTVFATAGLFILLYAEFMAAALVLIYAGAILITYVFVIMLASQVGPDDKPTVAQRMIDYDRVSKEPLAAAAIGFFFCLTLRRTGNLWFAVGFHMAWDWGETFFYSVPDSGTIFPGHLLKSSFHGPRWLTGGMVGPEGSVLCFVVIAVTWAAFAMRYPEVKYRAE